MTVPAHWETVTTRMSGMSINPKTEAPLGALGCLGVILLVVAVLALNAWIVMVVFGAVASIFGWPTLAFTEAVIVTIALGVVGSFFKSSN